MGCCLDLCNSFGYSSTSKTSQIGISSNTIPQYENSKYYTIDTLKENKIESDPFKENQKEIDPFQEIKTVEIPLETNLDNEKNNEKLSRIKLVGLENIGNSCFMNSALQCIINNEELSFFFLNQNFIEDKNEKITKTKLKLADKYYEILKTIWSGDQVTL